MKKDIRISTRLKRKLLLLAAISLMLASALELYTFGLSSGFLLSWLRAFVVIFVMTTVTALAIIPGISYGVNKAAKH